MPEMEIKGEAGTESTGIGEEKTQEQADGLTKLGAGDEIKQQKQRVRDATCSSLPPVAGHFCAA